MGTSRVGLAGLRACVITPELVLLNPAFVRIVLEAIEVQFASLKTQECQLHEVILDCLFGSGGAKGIFKAFKFTAESGPFGLERLPDIAGIESYRVSEFLNGLKKFFSCHRSTLRVKLLTLAPGGGLGANVGS